MTLQSVRMTGKKYLQGGCVICTPLLPITNQHSKVVYLEQNPSCRIMLEPKEVCTPRTDIIEHCLVGETLVCRILSMMPYVLCTWYPFGNQAQITKNQMIRTLVPLGCLSFAESVDLLHSKQPVHVCKEKEVQTPACQSQEPRLKKVAPRPLSSHPAPCCSQIGTLSC